MRLLLTLLLFSFINGLQKNDLVLGKPGEKVVPDPLVTKTDLDKAACKDCCPRPKATVTVTETGYLTVTCTHTRSSDRTEFTTVRFTRTVESVLTQTEQVNFVKTTTVVTSRQITTFATKTAVSFRYFTTTQTVFTSFGIATVTRTTRTLTTRFISTLVFTTTTRTDIFTVTVQTVETSVSSSTLSIGLVDLQITTITEVITETGTLTVPIFDRRTLQNSPTTFFSTSAATATILGFPIFVLLQSFVTEDDLVSSIATRWGTRTFFDTVSINTALVGYFTVATSTKTYSRLYPYPTV